MGSMVDVRCTADIMLPLSVLTPFQGALKKRTDADVDALARSIREEGLLMPFAVWRSGAENLLLDGHGRRLALLRMAEQDPDVAEQDFPVVYVDAPTEEEARKALLQITSQYGKVSKWGLKDFTRSIPEYRAPVIDSFVKKAPSRRAKGHVNSAADKGEAEIRIMVRRDKVDAVLKLFEQVEYIRVCGYVQ